MCCPACCPAALLQAEALSRLQRWRMACLVWCSIFGAIGVALLVPGLFTSYPLTAMLRFFLGVWVIVALGVVPSAWFLSLKVSPDAWDDQSCVGMMGCGWGGGAAHRPDPLPSPYLLHR